MVRQQSTPEQQSVRVLKVGERVRHILSELLARGEAHDDVHGGTLQHSELARKMEQLRIVRCDWDNFSIISVRI